MSMTTSMATLPGVGSPLRLAPVTNLEGMYALDVAWNARDWETFAAYHDQSDVIVYWPGRETTHWRDGKIVEEYLMYDNASFMQHIGLA